MSDNKYNNFVRPSEVKEPHGQINRKYLSGNDAKKLYQDIISAPESSIHVCNATKKTTKVKPRSSNITTDNHLFLAAQNDDHEELKIYLEKNPHKIDILDEFGWSLLMIACKANAENAVKVLLDMNIDQNIKDKAGNSANKILIKQKNYNLINLIINHNNSKNSSNRNVTPNELEPRLNPIIEPYDCEVCQKSYPDKKEHLASTVHNMLTTKRKKFKACYAIPESNRGYQILVKSGWDGDSGLGPEGKGKQYPVRTVMKKDRKGLGISKKKCVNIVETLSDRTLNKRSKMSQFNREKCLEKNFRREFYDF